VSASGALPIAVAVVSFQTREVLEPCLASVVAAEPTEVVVVDNGSTDGSIELVRERFPSVNLVVNERNRGYGPAANQAIAATTAPAVLLLNSDTVLAADALASLGAYLGQHPRAAVVGPRLANADGSLQRSTFPWPSLGDLLVGDTGLHLLLPRLPAVRERFLRSWSHDRPRPVPWVRGAVLAIRRSAFDAVGGFDEAFFMYWEEVDLCRRLAATGWETHFAPVTTVVHARAVSTAKQPQAMKREWLAGFRRYLLRHESRRTATAILGLLHAFVRTRALRDRVRLRLVRNPERRARVAGLVDGWAALLSEPELWRA
jgi:N-acetylglucosaminyl-diphospho-decaprenol L-rhamnosyltransferase